METNEQDNVALASQEQQTRLRSYQQEMLNSSLERNVIVSMDTGSGKTHVALFRILASNNRLRS